MRGDKESLTQKNIWSTFSYEKKHAWLEIVRRYHHPSNDKSFKPDTNRKKSFFQIDGALITDVPSLYCAIGEALNGPRGYYGTCLDSLDDCLCGGFGPTPPFSLKWINADIPKKKLDRMCRIKEWIRRDLQGGEKTTPADYTIHGHGLFEAIIDLLSKHGVTIIIE